MDRKQTTIIFAAAVFGLLVACAYLFYSAQITAIDFLDLISIDSIISKALEFEIVALMFILPLPLAIISSLVHSHEKKDVYTVAMGGGFAAMLVSFLLFGTDFEFVLIAFAFLLGLVLLVEISYVRKDELKHAVTFRAASQSAQKLFIILAVALFVASASVGIAQNDLRVKKFGDTFMGIAFDQQLGTSSLADVSANLLIETQKQTVQGIIASPAYQTLTTKNDPDVVTFVASMQGLSSSIESAEYRAQMQSEIRKNAMAVKSPLDFETLRKQSPLIDTIASYLWLLNAFAAASMFLTVANLLLANIAGAYASVFRKVIEAVLPKI